MTRERGLRAESKNCEILLLPTADRRFDTKVKCPTGRASFWVKFRTVRSLTRVKCPGIAGGGGEGRFWNWLVHYELSYLASWCSIVMQVSLPCFDDKRYENGIDILANGHYRINSYLWTFHSLGESFFNLHRVYVRHLMSPSPFIHDIRLLYIEPMCSVILNYANEVLKFNWVSVNNFAQCVVAKWSFDWLIIISIRWLIPSRKSLSFSEKVNTSCLSENVTQWTFKRKT